MTNKIKEAQTKVEIASHVSSSTQFLDLPSLQTDLLTHQVCTFYAN